MFLAQDRISGTLTDPLLISIEKKSLRETIGYTKPYHSDSKQTSQPSHILFFDKCVIRSIVQQKYENNRNGKRIPGLVPPGVRVRQIRLQGATAEIGHTIHG